MTGHSILPPSSAGIWGSTNGCTGWVTMTQQLPDVGDDTDAMEGEASHQIGATIISGAAIGRSFTSNNFVGQTADNGVIYTDEMFEAARLYAYDVIDVMRTHAVFGGDDFGVEQRLLIPMIHEQSFGTPDMYLFSRSSGDLYVWDYKFGHELVEVFENWQMMNYLAGLVDKLNINGHDEQHITVHIRVVQPRGYHSDGSIREWVTTLSNLRGYWNILNHNAHKALSDAAEIHPGSHCKHCSARHGCAAALNYGVRLYELSMRPVPQELSTQALGTQLSIIKNAKKQLEYLESGFEEQVKRVIKSGQNVPGWIAEMGKGRLKWNKPVSEVVALGSLMGHDLKKPDEAITPTQAIALGMDKSLVMAYAEKPNTGLKVKADNGNKAKLIFGS